MTLRADQIDAAVTALEKQLMAWHKTNPVSQRLRKFVFDDGKKSDVTPIRFVCACEKGHLQHINWKWARKKWWCTPRRWAPQKIIEQIDSRVS